MVVLDKYVFIIIIIIVYYLSYSFVAKNFYKSLVDGAQAHWMKELRKQTHL